MLRLGRTTLHAPSGRGRRLSPQNRVRGAFRRAAPIRRPLGETVERGGHPREDRIRLPSCRPCRRILTVSLGPRCQAGPRPMAAEAGSPPPCQRRDRPMVRGQPPCRTRVLGHAWVDTGCARTVGRRHRRAIAGRDGTAVAEGHLLDAGDPHGCRNGPTRKPNTRQACALASVGAHGTFGVGGLDAGCRATGQESRDPCHPAPAVGTSFLLRSQIVPSSQTVAGCNPYRRLHATPATG